MPTRRRMPPERLRIRGVHPGLEPDQGEDPAHLVVTGLAVGPLLEDGDVVDEVEGAEVAVEPGLLREVAQLTADGEAAVGRRRDRVRAPTACRRRAAAPSRGSGGGWSCRRRWDPAAR